MLRSLTAEITRIERAIDKLITASPIFCAKQDLLKTIPGVGDVVARTFIAELPELGTVDRHKIAALVGLAPMNHDSGKMRGERHISGGRPQIRSPLFAACLSVIQHNPPLRSVVKSLLSFFLAPQTRTAIRSEQQALLQHAVDTFLAIHRLRDMEVHRQ